MEEQERKYIYNRKIALELSKAGFSIIDIIKNKHKKHIDIYVFDNTKEFKEYFDILLINKNKIANERNYCQWKGNTI